MSNYEDKDLLDLVLGGQTVREMSAIGFLSWLTDKLDGVPAYKADTQELLVAVRSAPMGRNMPDQEKVRLLRKLEALNIPIV